MAVEVPGSTSGNIVSEYAATNIRINRHLLKDANGFIISAFSANLDYEKKTFVIDSNKNKLGIVIDQENVPVMPMPGTTDNNRGSISLDMASFAQYFSKVCHEGEILGELVANLADEIIRQDLIKKGVLSNG